MLRNRKVILITAIVILAIILIGTTIFAIYKNKQNESIVAVKPEEPIQVTIPNIIQDDFEFSVVAPEKNSENVVFSLTCKEDVEYSIYYNIVNKQELENGQAEIKDEDYTYYENEITLNRNSVIFFKYKSEEQYSKEAYKIDITTVDIEEIGQETEEGASEEELKKEKVDKKDTKSGTSPYYIKVNYGANVVTIYKKDENGEYTVPMKAMICSSGVATPTSGVYKTTNKYTWRFLVGNVWGQYATRIVGSILFHSVPYMSNSKDTLEYWEYDKLGTKASAGCIRLTVQDARWIYSNCPSGTMVEFYSSSDPGPLGKPSSKKISSNEQCRNWDPTDPDSANPWRNNIEEPEDNNQVNTPNPPQNNENINTPNTGDNKEEEPNTKPDTGDDKEEKPNTKPDIGDDKEEKSNTKPDTENNKEDKQ